eukprot:2175595-Prymnesium_polylepis.1
MLVGTRCEPNGGHRSSKAGLLCACRVQWDGRAGCAALGIVRKAALADCAVWETCLLPIVPAVGSLCGLLDCPPLISMGRVWGLCVRQRAPLFCLADVGRAGDKLCLWGWLVPGPARALWLLLWSCSQLGVGRAVPRRTDPRSLFTEFTALGGAVSGMGHICDVNS